MTQTELLYAPWKIVLLLNISEYTNIFSATYRSVASVQLSSKWRWMSPRAQWHYCGWTQKQTGTCATPWSLHQPSGEVHWHLQVSFYLWVKHHGIKFPAAPLVSLPTTVSRYTQHAAHLPPSPPHVFLHTHEWPFWLQRHAHGTTCNKNVSLWNSPETQNLSSTWCRCLVYWVLPRPLPLSQDIRTGYLGRTNWPHCFLLPSWICSPF